MALFWKLTRNLATRTVPAMCVEERVWVPAYIPPGGGSDNTGRFCSTVRKEVRVPVWEFIPVPPRDPDDDYDGPDETSGGGSDFYVGESPPDRPDGVWAIVGYRIVEEDVEECHDTQEQDGPDSPTPGDGSGGPGRYVVVENCTDPYTETYTPADWNASCQSMEPLQVDGDYTFKLPALPTGVITGLGLDVSTFRDVEHGFYIYRAGTTYARIIENGVFKTGAKIVGAGDTLRITRTLGVITYYIDDVLVYTSSVVSSGPVYAYGFLYLLTDEIHQAALEQRNTAYVDATLQAVTADLPTADPYIYAAIQPVAVDASAPGDAAIEATLQAVGAAGSGIANYSYIDATLSPVAANGYTIADPVPPELSYIDAVIAAVDAQGYLLEGQAGHIDATLQAVSATGIGIEDYSYIDATLSPVQAIAIEYTPLADLNQASVTFNLIESVTGVVDTEGLNSGADLTLHLIDSVTASGSVAGADETLDLVESVTGLAGTYRDIQADETLSLVESVAGQADLTRDIRADVTLSLVDSVHAGGSVASLVETFSIVESIAGQADLYRDATLAETLDLIESVAGQADTYHDIRVNEVLSLLEDVTGGGGAYLEETLNLVSAIVGGNEATSSQTYVTNLRNRATTVYSAGYRRFLRLGNQHYAIGHDDVLYLLEGDTRDGEVIAGHVVSFPSDLGSSMKKRIAKAYLDARVSGTDGIEAGFIADESLRSMHSVTDMADGARLRPFKPGRGLRGQRFALEFTTTGQTEVTAVEIVVEHFSRRVT